MKNTTTKIIVIFVVVVAVFIIYTKWDFISNYVKGILGAGTTKTFKVVGQDIGPYLQGDYVIAEKDTYSKRNPQVGEVVVYEITVNGKATDAIGTVVGLPNSTVKGKYAPANYYLIQKENAIEAVPRDKITWLVVREAV